MRKGLWALWFTWFFLQGSPLWAQTPPADFRSWFFQQVQGKPATQMTLDALSESLNCVGSAVTPPNAAGQKSKVFDSQRREWTRVIEGDPLLGGSWTWVPQGIGAGPDPVLRSCDAPIPVTPPTQPPTIDLSSVNARLDFIYQQLYAQQERTHANLTAQISETRQQLKSHDERPNPVLEFLKDPKTISAIVGAVGSCAATQCWK